MKKRALNKALAREQQAAGLSRSDFVEIGADFDLLVRLIHGAIKSRAQGLNILIHGPLGTGKTGSNYTPGAYVRIRKFTTDRRMHVRNLTYGPLS